MHYGTHPDIPDKRDHYFKPQLKKALPESADLRPHFPPVYDQKKLNSCSANAIGAAVWYEARRAHPRVQSPSRLFIYYNERAKERKVAENAPVSLRDGYKSISRTGVCPESMWPYLTKKFRDRPPKPCYAAAEQERVIGYARVHRKADDLRACIASGHPFTLGISVHESFESERMKRTGRAAMPKRGERVLGGHAVVAVGYHDQSQRFMLRNSWGKKWGLDGYFTLPYDYLLDENYAWDFWMIRELSDELAARLVE